jgi:two-component system sensor histidine kinase KdpD
MGFAALHLEDGFLLASYFVVALVGNRLAALRAAEEQARILAQSERLHQTLLDSVSHELKTPVAVFRAAVEQLEFADADKRRNLIFELRTAGLRLDNLVANLLNQSRLESGVLKPQLDWCDAHDLVAAARRSVGSRLDGRPIEIEIPLDFPLLLADAVLMEQALAQLLLNAALYTPDDSRIRVEAGEIKEPERIQLIVADQGPGIAPEIQAKIFDKFSRGPSARGSGLGLGLSIVRGFMLAQGGDVTVETPAGGGTRFALMLPYVAAASAPAG